MIMTKCGSFAAYINEGNPCQIQSISTNKTSCRAGNIFMLYIFGIYLYLVFIADTTEFSSTIFDSKELL